MTHIDLDIPDHAKEKRIYIFLGRECYGIQEPNGDLFIKKVRCNMCGKCCMDIGETWGLGTKKIDGIVCCKYLNKGLKGEWTCGANGIAPFSCCRDNVEMLAHKDCVIEYEKMEQKA